MGMTTKELEEDFRDGNDSFMGYNLPVHEERKKRKIIIGKADAERTYVIVSDVVGHTYMPYERSSTNRSRKGKTNDHTVIDIP
ncbi:hypothetical protein Tco_0819352 [Tanacetum coccineum]|uniref:Uncharacterized protein n=1 Tax=Tanacetum coccineum TaxID=301880 RepID=A0ABQ5AA85_9ASTR